MGEPTMQIIEQNVKHNTEDIRELKKRMEKTETDVGELRAGHQVTNQTLSHVMSTLDELKKDFKTIDKKIDENQIEQLQAYKNGVFKIGITVIGGLILGFFMVFFGFN